MTHAQVKRFSLITSLFVAVILQTIMLARLGHSFKLLTTPLLIRAGAVPLSCTALAAASPVGVSPYTHTEAKRIAVDAVESLDFDGDVLIVPMFKPSVDGDGTKEEKDKRSIERLIPSLPAVKGDIHSLLKQIVEENDFKADASTKQVVRIVGNDLGVKYVALVGLGASKEGGNADLEVKTASKLGKVVSSIAKETKSESVGLVMPEGVTNAAMSPFLIAIQDALYIDNRFKKTPEGGFPPQKWKQLKLLGCSSKVAADMALNKKLTEMIVSGVEFAKDLVGRCREYQLPSLSSSLLKECAKGHLFVGFMCTIRRTF